MIFDSTNLFSDAQAITATAVSTNVIDFGATDTPKHAVNAITRDVGKGRAVDLFIQSVEDFDSAANDGTLTVTLELDAAEAFGGGADQSIDLGTFAEADLVAGFRVPIHKLPLTTSLRYARLAYTVAGSGNFTAGKVTAGFVFAGEERDV
jgi:hypothetical protein